MQTFIQNIKKSYIVMLLMLLIINILFIYLYFFYNSSDIVCLDDKCIKIELAITPQEHSKWLMLRESLDHDRWMLFVFEKEDLYSFWMKNTLISLDMIWIDENKKIVFINKNTQPCPQVWDCPIVNPWKIAKYVLEINSWESDRIWLKEWDILNFQIKY